ncbi:circadian clock-controlled protein-like [Trichoplusia ni]|uniref:Circadian clock-controlled protein-like n=1 Tax=Trichoplusia ni TaxID=7111 RepID=A0A7E5WUP9_TRINI|nr:circadian clock-controlled protein-like [Trichoplusia ni]
MNSKIAFLVFALCVAYSGAGVAPFIKKCKSEDSKCLKEVTQATIPIFTAGLPELGVQRLDPFYMKTLDASSPGLSLKLWDVNGTGLKDCIAKKVQRDVSKSKLIVKLQCTVDFVAKYEMNGRLLVLPIEGKGDAHVVLRKVVITADVDMGDKIGKDGEKHWKVKSFRHTYDLKDESTIELENLFNGNEVLGRAARDLIKSSSNEIVKEVGPPIVKAIVSKIVDTVDHFFQNVPASELSLD